jgi:hypothetical protein
MGFNKVVIKSISAENEFSEPVLISSGEANFSLSGTWTATVHLQRRLPQSTTWGDVASYVSNGEFVGREPEENVLYRFGVKTGNYSSGTVEGRIGVP